MGDVRMSAATEIDVLSPGLELLREARTELEVHQVIALAVVDIAEEPGFDHILNDSQRTVVAVVFLHHILALGGLDRFGDAQAVLHRRGAGDLGKDVLSRA